jgi:hypothetical protein
MLARAVVALADFVAFRRSVRDDWVVGTQFDPSRLHHAVWVFGTLWRLATLARDWRAFLLLSLRFSVPAAAVGIFRGVVSARKNFVPGWVGFLLLSGGQNPLAALFGLVSASARRGCRLRLRDRGLDGANPSRSYCSDHSTNSVRGPWNFRPSPCFAEVV